MVNKYYQLSPNFHEQTHYLNSCLLTNGKIMDEIMEDHFSVAHRESVFLIDYLF